MVVPPQHDRYPFHFTLDCVSVHLFLLATSLVSAKVVIAFVEVLVLPSTLNYIPTHPILVRQARGTKL